MKTAEEVMRRRLAIARKKDTLNQGDELDSRQVFDALCEVEDCIRECSQASFSKEWVLDLLDSEFAFIWNPDTGDEDEDDEDAEDAEDDEDDLDGEFGDEFGD